MKKKCLISLLLSTVVLFSLLLGGCFGIDAAKKSADIYCSLIFKNDAQNLDKIGKGESQKDQIEGSLKKQLKDNISIWGGNASQDQIDKISDAYLENLSKITYETKQVSKSGDTAEVEISTTHFSQRKADEQAIMAAIDEIEGSTFSSETEQLDKLGQVYLDKLPDCIRNIEMSTEKSTNTYTFKKEGKYWVPENEQELVYKLTSQACNDENLNLSIDETRITPTESAEIFWNLTAKADISGFEKLGYSKEFADRLVKFTNKRLIDQAKKEFSIEGVSLSDGEIENVVQAMFKCLQKNKAEFEEVSTLNDTAQVKITTTVIDLTTVTQQATTKTTNDAVASGNIDKEAIIHAYCTNFIDELNKAEPQTKPGNSITFNFTKVADLWIPSDINNFSNRISNICLK